MSQAPIGSGRYRHHCAQVLIKLPNLSESSAAADESPVMALWPLLMVSVEFRGREAHFSGNES